MTFTTDQLYKTQAEIVQDMLTDLVSIISDAYTGDDGQFSIIFNVIAGQVENLLLANQLVLDDIFIQTASGSALSKHGDELGLPMKTGVEATGELFFAGDPGTSIPQGSEVSTNPDTSTLLFYTTTETVSIPNPGIPTALTTAVGSGTGLTGGYDYEVTFVTATGETTAGPFSNLTNVSNQKVNLTAIPIGGPGTVSRNIYRRKAGVFQGRVTNIADNTTTTFTDNVADGSVVSVNPPTFSTANTVIAEAIAEDTGTEYNVIVGTINQLTDTPTGITSVNNVLAFGDINSGFTAGDNPEDIDVYRSRLLQFLQSPQTGSVSDIQNWALEVDGISTASVFTNNNLGTSQNGHTTVRISGANGSVPGSDLVSEVQGLLDSKEIANLQIHVTTFTPAPVNVTAATTLDIGYVLSDVSAEVTSNIQTYINSIAAGGTVYVAGIIDSVFGDVPGVLTLSVSVPSSDITTSSSQKATPGTISIS